MRLPKEVAEAIESLREPVNGFSNYSIIGMMNEYGCNFRDITILNEHMGQDKLHPDTLIEALVNGYEVIEEPEVITITTEQKQAVIGYHNSLQHADAFTQGERDRHKRIIRTTLGYIGIEWEEIQ